MLKVERRHGLPPFAWVARIRNREVIAVCGDAVETTATSLVEGVWDGDFTSNDFDSANHLFGSGLRVNDRSVRIVTPAHTLEGIYVLRTFSDFAVSNSLPLLLAYSKVMLPMQTGYAAKIATLVNGLTEYIKTLASFDGHSLCRFVYHNVVILDGQLYVEHKRTPDRFSSYDDYINRLRCVLKKLLANAASPKRRSRLTPMTTCSSGYDSAACAAIGAQVGIRRAITLTTSNRGDCDSGADVARALGLAVIEEKRPDNLHNEGVDEAKFLCAGFGGEDFSFCVLLSIAGVRYF